MADGASLLIGGDSPGGQFMNPTVLVDVPRNATCFIEEIFGPVVSVAKFSNINEIVEIANDCNFGLYATIWT